TPNTSTQAKQLRARPKQSGKPAKQLRDSFASSSTQLLTLPFDKTTQPLEMKRCSYISSPLLALALLLLICFFHYAAAARLLPTVPPLVHQESGVKVASVDGLALQNGDELSVSEMMGAEEEAACEEGNDECMQRRLLHDAHLDYIYTQHKGGKP
ncbi:unnamed protein product, partial [Urochloa humidicola]